MRPYLKKKERKEKGHEKEQKEYWSSKILKRRRRQTELNNMPWNECIILRVHAIEFQTLEYTSTAWSNSVHWVGLQHQTLHTYSDTSQQRWGMHWWHDWRWQILTQHWVHQKNHSLLHIRRKLCIEDLKATWKEEGTGQKMSNLKSFNRWELFARL